MVVLKDGLKSRVGNGEKIKIWSDKWLPCPTTYKVISPMTKLEDFATVDMLIHRDTMQWKRELIDQVFCPRDAEIILEISLSIRHPNDRLIWTGTKRGIFTVKSAYQMLRSQAQETEASTSSSLSMENHLWSSLWFGLCTTKGEVLDFVASSLDRHKHKARGKRAGSSIPLQREEKLDGKNYDIWHRKIQYLLDELEVLETLTNSMEEPEQGNSAQNRGDLEAYQSWHKKDRCPCFTMLSSMHNDLIGKFESYGTAQDMWIALKEKFGGTTVTRLRTLTLKFDTFRMQCGDSMQEHLRKMSVMVRELKAVGNNLTDEQQIQVVIRSLPVSWEQMKLNMTHNESIQMLEDLSRHLELEAEHRATYHLVRDRVGFVEYRRVPAGSRWMRIRNESRVEVLGIGTYKLQLRHGHTLLLHDVLYAPGMRLGHIGQDRMTRLAREGLLGPFAKVNLPTYEHCLAGKSTRKPFEKVIRAMVPLELIHFDVCGPMNVRARHRASYFITFIDDFTHYGHVYLVSHKVRSIGLLQTIHEFGYVHNATHKHGKLGPRANKCVFITYSDESKGYVMLGEHPNGGVTEIVSRDVEFMENDFLSRGDVGQSLELYEMVESWDDTPATNPGDSGREITPRESFISAAQDDMEPRSYDEAMSSLACNEWMTAMKDEMESMRTNQVWELADLPPRRKSIGNKWVLKIKRKADGSIDKYKARLVAKAMVASLDLELHQMDVKTAFLNGDLDEEIFMDQPIGFVVKGQERKVCRLNRSLYVLKQSFRQWYKQFHQKVISNGFLMIEEDHCVYVNIILSLYVDDIQLAGNNKEFIKTIKEWLSSTFKMKDMIEASFVFGVKILRDHSRKLLGLSQETYIRTVLERFHMQDCKPIDTPVGKGDSLSSVMCSKTQAEIKSMAQTPYTNAISSLMYAMLCTYPDICFVVGLGKDFRLRGYSDADWESDLDERKSTSSYTFLLGGWAITWCSKKQSCVALSTMESEYIVCSAAVWLRRFLQHLDIVASAMDPVTIYSGSMAALAYAKDPKYHGKTKHIEIKYHYIRDMVAKKETLKESGLMKNSSQALGAIGLRSVRWKYQDAFMTYAPLRKEEKSIATCDHTTCARNDHQIGRQRLDDYFFGMLPIVMDYSALRDMTGRSAEPKLSGIRGMNVGTRLSDFVRKVEYCSEFVGTHEGLEDTQFDVKCLTLWHLHLTGTSTRHVGRELIRQFRCKEPPGSGRYKMNVAFCLSPGNSQAGLGVLVQDHNGAVATAMCTQILLEGDVLQAHARSLLIALQFAFDIGLRLLEVDVRCQELLGLLNHDCNKAVYALATEALSSNFEQVWLEDHPTCIISFV
uniref:Reverse transcriptase Ty1/copia-type domain-containing protein n=1 Tax=Fagus sylvatica TaxID=28930 RepID=A0A2N9IEQ3_FAGSY